MIRRQRTARWEHDGLAATLTTLRPSVADVLHLQGSVSEDESSALQVLLDSVRHWTLAVADVTRDGEPCECGCPADLIDALGVAELISLQRWIVGDVPSPSAAV